MYSIGVILPSAKLFGGVRRFFELGERFIQRGHQMIILTPEGVKPDWGDYASTVDKVENISRYKFTALIIMQKEALQLLLDANAEIKIFYHILQSEEIKSVIKHKEIKVFANSTNILLHDKKKYGIKASMKQGGVSLPETIKDVSIDDEVFTIMCFGRLVRKRKGTRFVVKAAEKIYKRGYKIKLLLYDTPIDEHAKELIKNFKTKVPYEFVLNHLVAENESLFKRASVFVSAEKNAGWSNSSAEALACGIPLIATLSGTKDFLVNNETGLMVRRNSFSIAKALKKIIKDKQLRIRLSINGRKKIEMFGWDHLSDDILNYIQHQLKSTGIDAD